MSDEPIRDAFAERLDHLMRTVTHPDGGSWTNIRMSHALKDVGVAASAPYISQLRSGAKNNPAASYVGAFAKLLGVPVTYFYAKDTAAFERDRELIQAMTAIRNDGVEEFAVLARGLPPDALEVIRQVELTYRQVNGLPIPEDYRRPPSSGGDTEPPQG